MLAVALLPWFGAAAQSGGGAPAFELASVRPARPGRGGAPRFAVTPGRLTVQNTSLRHIILEAYGVEDYRLRGPDWIDSERYDIVAKLPDGAGKEQIPRMLQVAVGGTLPADCPYGNQDCARLRPDCGQKRPAHEDRGQRARGSKNERAEWSRDQGKTTMAKLADVLSDALDCPASSSSI